LSFQICIFEDEKYTQFLPLTHTRPVWDLKCGITSLRDKLVRAYPGVDIALFCRQEIAGVVKAANPGIDVNRVRGEELLFLNGRLLADSDLSMKIPVKGPSKIYKTKNDFVAARCTGSAFNDFNISTGSPLKISDWGIREEQVLNLRLVDFCWDLLEHNTTQIVKDATAFQLGRQRGKINPGVHIISPEKIYLGENSVLMPGVVLDAEGGPIIIADEVKIMPNAVISGPVYIGEDSLVKPGANLTGSVSIGPTCKVAGEIGSCIIQGYSNKQHDGFLGNSYLGEWINLGAGTSNSDLKNNYSNVQVTIDGSLIDTGRLLMGLIMGDHSKTAINTRLNTGSVIGVCCNVFGNGFPPKYLPSFTWSGENGPVIHQLDKAMKVAVKVMGRRAIHPTKVYIEMLEGVFKNTGGIRNKFGVR